MPLKGYWRRGKGIRFCFGQPHRRQQAQLGCASEPGASTIDTCMFDPRQVSELDHLCSVWITRMCTNLRFRLWASAHRIALVWSLLLGFLYYCFWASCASALDFLHYCGWLDFLRFYFWASCIIAFGNLTFVFASGWHLMYVCLVVSLWFLL